jgi:ComF family protein
MRSCAHGRSLTVNSVRAISAFAVDLVYPKRCAGCGRRGGWLCPDCEREIERFAPPWCPTCGIPTHYPCRCASMPQELAEVRSVGPFAGWMRGAVIHCKYHGEWGRTAELGALVAGVCESLCSFDALVPVPLHPSRRRQRGFNQSLLIAQRAAELLRVPVEENVLRVRRTGAQVHLGAEERATNVTGAMAIRPGCTIEGRTFVLIDDVITTGSTLAACAAVLLRAGAQQVKAATLCREL